MHQSDGKRFADVCFWEKEEEKGEEQEKKEEKRKENGTTCTRHPMMVALEDEQAPLAIRLLAR